MSGAASGGALGNHRLTLENVPARESSPILWGDLVESWERYIEEKDQEALVFRGAGEENDGELMAAPYSHRFQQEYTEMQYAKIQGFIRGSLAEYDDPYLVFLTFSTTTTKPNGEPRPPLDHLDELLEPWGDGVYYELQRVMAGDRERDPWEPRPGWEYLYILEPTTNEGQVSGGYGHAHAALVVDGAVDPARFESVIDRHLTECPGARGEAHEFEDAIEVKRAEELGNPGAYLFKYLGKSWNVEAIEDYERRFAALLFDQGRQRFRASNGAQRWMQREESESESGEWEFVGIGQWERVRELLSEYDSVEDFHMQREGELSAEETSTGGIRAWLNRQETHLEPDPEPGPEQRRITHEEFEARERAGVLMPWEYQSEPDSDRPPPVV